MESSHKIPKTGKSHLNVPKSTVPTGKQNLGQRWKIHQNHLRAKSLSDEASMCRRKCIRASVCIVLSILGAFLSLAALRYKGFIYEISKPFVYMEAVCVLFFFYAMLSLFSGVMLLFAVIKNDMNQKKILASLIVTGIAFAIILYRQVWALFAIPLADLQDFAISSIFMVFTLCPFTVLFNLALTFYKIMEKLKKAQDAIVGTKPDDELANDLFNEMKYFHLNPLSRLFLAPAGSKKTENPLRKL